MSEVDFSSAMEITKAYMDKEISLCTTEEQVRQVEKFWKKYLAEVNRYIADKREEPPYLSENGKTIV